MRSADRRWSDATTWGESRHARVARASPARGAQGCAGGRLLYGSPPDFLARYRMSQLLTGSAAARIASHLKKAGARLVVPPESFFMERDVPPQGEKRRHEMEGLEPGEEGRATEWAA